MVASETVVLLSRRTSSGVFCCFAKRHNTCRKYAHCFALPNKNRSRSNPVCVLISILDAVRETHIFKEPLGLIVMQYEPAGDGQVAIRGAGLEKPMDLLAGDSNHS